MIQAVKNKAGAVLIIFFFLAAAVAAGYGSEEGPPVIEIEKLIGFEGNLQLVLPSGETKTVAAGEELPPLPVNTLVTILSGSARGIYRRQEVSLKTGETARIVRPPRSAEKIVKRTGSLKITFPSGEMIVLAAQDPIPDLPPRTLVEVLDGNLTVRVGGEYIVVLSGETVLIVSEEEEERVLDDTGQIRPMSP